MDMDMPGTDWIELVMPEQMKVARGRKAFYEHLLVRYDSLGWWGRFKMRQREFLHIPTIRRMAAESLEDHLEFVTREVVFDDGSRAPYFRTSLAYCFSRYAAARSGTTADP